MRRQIHRTTPSGGLQLAVALAFALLVGADIVMVTHAEDVLPSAPGNEAITRHAAYPRSQRISVEERVQRLSENLSLSAQQQAQVRTILTRRQTELEQLRVDSSPTAVERVHMYRAVDEKAVERIKQVLTEEQRQKYSPPRAPPDKQGATAANTASAPAGQQSP